MGISRNVCFAIFKLASYRLVPVLSLSADINNWPLRSFADTVSGSGVSDLPSSFSKVSLQPYAHAVYRVTRASVPSRYREKRRKSDCSRISDLDEPSTIVSNGIPTIDT
jgi:hypothetical protein